VSGLFCISRSLRSLKVKFVDMSPLIFAKQAQVVLVEEFVKPVSLSFFFFKKKQCRH